MEEQIRAWGIPVVGKEIFTVQGEYSANMLRKAILHEEVKTDTQPRHRVGPRFSVPDVRTAAYFPF